MCRTAWLIIAGWLIRVIQRKSFLLQICFLFFLFCCRQSFQLSAKRAYWIDFRLKKKSVKPYANSHITADHCLTAGCYLNVILLFYLFLKLFLYYISFPQVCWKIKANQADVSNSDILLPNLHIWMHKFPV